MNQPQPNISVNVDVTNPGQFFACCGLLELADRLWPGAEGWFAVSHSSFHIQCKGNGKDLVREITESELIAIEPENETSSPLRLGKPFDLMLDWWNDELCGGKQLKVWAGRMSSTRISLAMRQAIDNVPSLESMFDHNMIVFDPENPSKKVEPFYFDSRRGWNAQSLDIGFPTESLNMNTLAHPAVEFLCLVGLQRCRPVVTANRRIFRYGIWDTPLPAAVVPAAITGLLSVHSFPQFEFENAFRTPQKKHKAFLPATPIGEL